MLVRLFYNSAAHFPKTLVAVVLAVACIAGTASAQSANSRYGMMSAQESLIAEQQELINSQEALPNAY